MQAVADTVVLLDEGINVLMEDIQQYDFSYYDTYIGYFIYFQCYGNHHLWLIMLL